MKRRAKEKTKEITRLVLALIARGMATYVALGSPKALGRYGDLGEELLNYSASRIRSTLRRLRMLDMIQYDEEDEKTPIILTDKGMIRLARHRFRNLFRKKKKWDHFWRIIFFDVSESKKHVRDILRRELIAAGFYPFQKSVYVCPFDCEEAILDLCRIYYIADDVLFCITPSLGRKEKDVRAFFFQRNLHTKTHARKINH